MNITELVDDVREAKCVVGSFRISTHQNGAPLNAAYLEHDFNFATEELEDKVIVATGGIVIFPGAGKISDHSPVIVDFE